MHCSKREEHTEGYISIHIFCLETFFGILFLEKTNLLEKCNFEQILGNF